jgi:hypothetical protein
MISTAEAVPALGVGRVLLRAVRDFYEESWRLVLLNSGLSVWILGTLVAAAYFPPALILLLGAGPIAAALASAAVTIVDSGALARGDIGLGFRRCWRRGLVLGAALAAVGVGTILALRFYAGAGTLAWPLAVLILYLGGVFGVYQLILWPLAVRDCGRPLREVAVDAARTLLRRPIATTGLALALLLVNLAGLAAAVLPFLTMTIAYSAVAAARFALPTAPLEEA